MSNFLSRPGVKVGGLSPKAARLQAMLEKSAATDKSSTKPNPTPAPLAAKPKSNFANKKPSFQRKAV
jgi:hypothetical protein